MIDHYLSLSQLRDCVKYHSAIVIRRRAIYTAWRVEAGLEAPTNLSEIVTKGLFAMADAILYNPSRTVLSEAHHATSA